MKQMKWVKKDIGLLILISCLAIGFIGCGSGGENDLNNTNTSNIISPEVTSARPDNGAVNEAVTTTICIVFSVEMDKDSVEDCFSLIGSGNSPVHGAFSWSGNIMTFIPDANLSYGTTYTVVIDSKAKDKNGTTLIGGFNSTFTTVTKVSGKVVPPSGEEISNLNVVSLREEVIPNEDGKFSSAVNTNGVTVIGAIANDRESGLMKVVVTPSNNIDDPNQALVSSRSTAEAMVFLSPYLVTSDPMKAKRILEVIRQDPNVAILEEAITNTYFIDNPFNDHNLQHALSNATLSVLKTVLSTPRNSSSRNLCSPNTNVIYLPLNPKYLEATGKFKQSPYEYMDIDQVFTKVDIQYFFNNYQITIESKEAKGIDWISEFATLDPKQFSSRNDLVGRANGKEKFDRIPCAINNKVYVEGKSVFRMVDIFSFAVDAIFPDWPKAIYVPADKAGVYVIRSFSGGRALGLLALDKNTWNKYEELLGQLPNGLVLDKQAATANVIMASLETLSALPFIDEIPGLGVDTIKDLYGAILVETPQAQNANDYMLLVAKTNYKLLEESIKVETKKAAKGFLNLLKNLNKENLRQIGEKVITFDKLLEFTGKIVEEGTVEVISGTGETLDRLNNLVFIAAPLENAIIIVGDPWSEYYTSNPTLSVSPTTGQQGTTFNYTGTQYTASGDVELHVKKPDGTEYPSSVLSGKVNSSGNFSHTYLSQCSSQTGTYSIWTIDKATGRISNTVTENITTSSSCK